ncbi:MAG: PEGA domain-containing protein [Luteitalea sp.]|nr:PEGA domain-containing protein [Luteitalea sp.]
MKARWLLSVGAVTVALALPGTAVVNADQARPRNSEAAGRSSGGSSSGSGTAAPRSGGGSGSAGSSSPRSEPSRPRTAVPRGRSGSVTSTGTARRKAPEYSRPRGNSPVVGHAVPRRGVSGGGGSTIIVRPRSYYPWGFGWGSGYFYDPLWWGGGYWNPYWGPAWGGYWGHGLGPGYSGGPGYHGGYGAYVPDDRGSLRLKVRPREAEVFVEGDFVGQVDDFDGAFQRLHLPPGRHEIQVEAPGYAPLEFSVLIVRDQTVTYRGELKTQ